MLGASRKFRWGRVIMGLKLNMFNPGHAHNVGADPLLANSNPKIECGAINGGTVISLAPDFADPCGGSNGFNENESSSPSNFGCGCATPDRAAGKPVLGTGGNRAIQLGLKLVF